MKEYFNLQIKMTIRKLSDFGLNPLIGFCLLLVGFILGSIYLFSRTEFAEYIYILIAISFVSRLSEEKRSDFLKSVFFIRSYFKLRIIENVIVIFPFVLFLVYKQSFLSILILTIMAFIMAFYNFNNSLNYTIPTPFYKKPFEFAVGFRNTFYLLFMAYFLALMAVIANNFNLGVFSLILVFLMSVFFYSKPENEYYIWIFNKTPVGFLYEKVKIALFHSTILVSPILIILELFFYQNTGYLLLVILLAYVFLAAIIMAKYSAYPYEIGLPQILLICIGLIFPPFLIAVLPFFYLQAIKRLKNILG